MSEQIHPPVSLGRQQLLFSVGHGGMSDVYLALVNSAAGVNKLLVVKQLRASLLDEPEALSMFMDEARLAARLHHPNVVATFEVGLEGPIPYMTMEFLDGQPLHRILRRLDGLAELTLGMRLRIITEMLQGLDYAHELLDYDGTPLNVVHRDVSPQNLFITYDGQIKLVDFGIAKANASINHTQGRGLKGKLAYMSPQQAGGEIVDRRADVFAAGVMLWELLSGRRLWADVNEATIARQLIDHELPALDIDGVRPRLLDICRTALAPRLADRYATADAFRVAIEQYVSDERLDIRTRAIGMLVAQAFAPERAEVRSRIDQELLRQVAGGNLADSPITLWRDRYRSENTERTLDSHAAESSLPPDEITADYGPRVADSGPLATKVLPPPREASGTIGAPTSIVPSSNRRPIWPILAAVAVSTILVIPALQKHDEPAASPSPSPSPSSSSVDAVDVAPTQASPAPTPSGCDAPLHTKPRVTLTGDIEQDATLHCDRSYVLMFTTRVTGGATLTIEPGTTILGDRQTKGTLVVEPGSRLLAEGTRERPIVFTSASPEAERRPGDWGGVLLLGHAPINLRDADGKPMLGQVEGLAEVSRYGGNDPEDDSGVLRYVRIEYPGVEVAPANESNGLTLAGVGRATVIDHVAVHASSDDCFEFFGGTVDAKHLVCDAPGDDGLDFDLGYRGRLQYVVVRDLALADAHSETPSNAFELDNDPNGTTAEPRTRPTIWNATLCGVLGGASPSYAILARRAAEAEIHGLLASGFDFALDVRDSSTIELSGLGLLEQPAAELDELGEHDDDNGFDERSWLADPSRAPVTDFAGFTGCGGPIPDSLFPASAIASPQSTPPVDDGFFDPTAVWVGAFAGPSDDWTAGWVSWRE